MFICMWGYPPFETADANDSWYRPIATKKFHRFWKKHKSIPIEDSGKDLLMKMLAYQPADRSNLETVLNCEWMSGEVSFKGGVFFSPTFMFFANFVEKKNSKSSFTSPSF